MLTKMQNGIYESFKLSRLKASESEKKMKAGVSYSDSDAPGIKATREQQPGATSERVGELATRERGAIALKAQPIHSSPFRALLELHEALLREV